MTDAGRETAKQAHHDRRYLKRSCKKSEGITFIIERRRCNTMSKIDMFKNHPILEREGNIGIYPDHNHQHKTNQNIKILYKKGKNFLSGVKDEMD
jgi:hypothetical protein